MSKLHAIILIMLLMLLGACGTSRVEVDTAGMAPEEIARLERIEDLKEKVEDEPKNMQWRTSLADEYLAGNQKVEALRVYEDGLQIDPSNSELKYNMAEIALELGDKRKAFTAFKDVLQGMDGDRYLTRIAPLFIDGYRVEPVIASDAPEAFAMYSGDGSKIIYQKYLNGNWDIYEYDRATGSEIALTTDASDEENPAVSRDGRFLVYTSTREDHRNVPYENKLRDIFIRDSKNGSDENLTTNSSNDWRPRFSKDARFIVFVSERNDLRNLEAIDLFSNVFSMERDGSFQVQLTKSQSNDGGPVMAGGESDPVYFDSNRSGYYAIYQTDGTGKEAKQITRNNGVNDAAPDVDPTGAHIAFFSDRDGNFEIYMMNDEGENQQKLTSNPADDTNPVFSPDGRKILFHTNRNGNYDIFELDLDQKTEIPSLYEVVNLIDGELARL
jgi:Tol biopolymer transport system component